MEDHIDRSKCSYRVCVEKKDNGKTLSNKIIIITYISDSNKIIIITYISDSNKIIIIIYI